MSKPHGIRYLKTAGNDLIDIFEYIKRDNPFAATSLLEKFDTSIFKLSFPFFSMIPNLKLFPDPILHTKSKEVTAVSEEVLFRIKQMKNTLYSMPGLALAGPQMGFRERIIVLNLMKINQQQEILVLINPTIRHSEGKVKMEEGCLSIPEIYEEITRPEKIKLGAIDLKSQEISMEADDNLARVIQHEIDHLDGILFWDHLSERKRNKLINKFLKSKEKSF